MPWRSYGIKYDIGRNQFERIGINEQQKKWKKKRNSSIRFGRWYFFCGRPKRICLNFETSKMKSKKAKECPASSFIFQSVSNEATLIEANRRAWSNHFWKFQFGLLPFRYRRQKSVELRTTSALRNEHIFMSSTESFASQAFLVSLLCTLVAFLARVVWHLVALCCQLRRQTVQYLRNSVLANFMANKLSKCHSSTRG